MGACAVTNLDRNERVSAYAVTNRDRIPSQRRGLALRLHRAGRRYALQRIGSQRAVEVNIAIMRTFVQLRRLMDSNRDLARRIEALETRYDEQFSQVFDAIKQLITDDHERKARPKRCIGFV